MNTKNLGRGKGLFRIGVAAVLTITCAGIARAQEKENIGKVQQGLVGGTVVSAEVQEQYGLLTLTTGTGSCSASLLRNNWAITAAHCVDDPDPNNPGQFIQVPEDSVTLTANWKSVQKRQSMRIITFRPNDVAIIRFDNSFTGQYANDGYNREIYRGELVALPIMAFGRGIFQFAQGCGAGGTPSQRDGQYRVGYFTTDREADNVYSYPSVGGQMMAGGDSAVPARPH